MRQRSVRHRGGRRWMPRQHRAKNGRTGNGGSRGWRFNVLTALGEREGAIQEAERRAREALRRMTEGLSVVCEAVENDASDERGRSASRVLGWSTTAMASRYTHVNHADPQ
jgi:hypothetical protein